MVGPSGKNQSPPLAATAAESVPSRQYYWTGLGWAMLLVNGGGGGGSSDSDDITFAYVLLLD